MSVPTGLTVSGSPITTDGTLAVSYTAGYAIPTTAKQTEWDTAFGWGNHASAGYVTSTSTVTLTNKRVTLRIGSVSSASTITPTSDTVDQYNVTALATTAVFAAPSGTPTDAQKLTIRIKDSGSGQTMSWTTTSNGYRAVGVTLPLSIAASKTIYVGCIWNAADSFWDVVSVATQA
jgi:hypothetical protein